MSEDSITLATGLRIPLIRRAATYTGLLRMIEAKPELLDGRQTIVYGINPDEDFEVGLCGEAVAFQGSILLLTDPLALGGSAESDGNRKPSLQPCQSKLCCGSAD